MADIANLDQRVNIRNQEEEDRYTFRRNMADADNIAFNQMQNQTATPEVDELGAEPTGDTTMLHMALAGAGMAPGIGIVADLADAALYGMEGDIAGAGLSLISAIPILGLVGGAGRVAKTARTGGKSLQEASGYKQMGVSPAAARNVDPFPGIKKMEDDFMRRIGDSEVESGMVQKVAEDFTGMVERMKGEMDVVQGMQRKWNYPEDTIADMLAFLKGNDAVRGVAQTGAVGGSALLDMQSAVARGARFFYSLDSYTQSQIMQDAEGDLPITEPIEI